MVRRRERTLFSRRSSWARAKLSSVTRAGTGISIQSSRGRSWLAVVLGIVTPRRRCGRITRPSRHSGLAEAGDAAIGGVTQHTPDDRAFPTTAFARRYASRFEQAGCLADAESLHCVHLIRSSYYTGLGFVDDVSGGRFVSLADITISIRSTAHHADLARVRPVSLATA